MFQTGRQRIISHLRCEIIPMGKWGTSANNRKARFYTLTKKGRTHFGHE